MVELRNQPCKFRVIEGAQATSFQYDRETGAVSGCIYDRDGKIIAESQRTSGVAGDRVKNADPDLLNKTFHAAIEIDRKAIYLGHYMVHYGHFLTETLSTFWALNKLGDALPVFHPFIFGCSAPSYIRDALAVFGMTPADIHFLTQPARFRELVVPDRAFGLNSFICSDYMVPIEKIRHAFERPGPKGRTVFLSRAQLAGDARQIANVAEVDELIEKLGIEIYHPEKMSFSDQMALFSSCETLIGFAGSALHNGVFMPRGSRVIEISDRRSPSSPLLTQQLCCLASGTELKHVPFKSSDGAGSFDLAFLNSKIAELI